MEKNVNSVIDTFLSKEKEDSKDEKEKTVVLNEREGLIERIDKKIITSDGRMLLREQY